jgi:hypothetical protein
MKFELLLEQLGNATGLDGVALDSSGNCTLCFDGEHDITFTRDAEDCAIILHGEVGHVASLGPESCRALLKASLLGAETDGSSLAVNTRSDLEVVVLWKRYDDAFDDYTALEKAINRFLGQIIFWKGKLIQMQQQEHLPPTAPTDMPKFGVRV